jgi:hypothetical protein
MSGAIPFIGPVLSVAAATSANEIGKFNQKVANRNAIIAEQEAAAQAKLTEFNIAKFNQSFEKFQSTTKVAEAKKLEEANFARISGTLARAQGRQQAIGYLAQAGDSLLTMKELGIY